MTYKVIDDQGLSLDAHFDVQQGSIIIHARGGRKNSLVSTNSQYGEGLRLLLRRMSEHGLGPLGAWVDSSTVQALPLSDREVMKPGELGLPSDQLFTLISSRMKTVGQSPGTSTGGNSTRRLRVRINAAPKADIVTALGGERVTRTFRSLDRLPHSDLAKVTPEFVWRAVQALLNDATHDFGASTDFDVLLADGTRLPPKAVFGLAATEALGFDVEPRHFTGGEGQPAFNAIREAGYTIVRKGEEPKPGKPASDIEWKEGGKKLRRHLSRERAHGLSAAKKAEFVKAHGRLFCERCEMDPVETFGGKHGGACIEVHHHRVQVKDMDSDHVTDLDDLQCLCANCHRVVHRLLKENEISETLGGN